LFTAPRSVDQPAAAPPRKQLLYVTATTLNVRARPNESAAILLSAPRGSTVVALSRQGDWYEVELTNGGSGWMSARYLSASKPQAPARDAAPPPKEPAFDRSAVVRAIIAESIASYPGNCPCPYNTDRAGRTCGRRSAWSKAGGYAPLCYESDVTRAMIDRYLARAR
jgi:hypothetical protein